MAQNFELALGVDPADDMHRPLADRMRPKTFEEVLGQEGLLAEGSLFRQALEAERFPSVVFWGPPGCGKTTIARLIAQHCNANFVSLSAISANTADLRKVFEQAKADKGAGKQTLLLIDEIHRYNRAQQDLFLPYIEDGTIILIGATTENPSFELNAALLSRCKVLVLKSLTLDTLVDLTYRAEKFTGQALQVDEQARETLAMLANGDGRYLLGMCEDLFGVANQELLNSELLLKLVQKRMPIYDKSQDGHYNLLSALHKSLRASDVNAALYWASRAFDSGEDRLSIIRRMVAFAAEDVAMADPNALVQALAAKDGYEFLGSPEGEKCIMQALVYLASCPKSNAVYMASKAAMRDVQQHGSLPPPKHALNAPTKLMKEEGYGQGYIYDHDTKGGFSGLSYFPEGLTRQDYYQPVGRGFEREIQKRLEYWQKLRSNS